ncbi:MAG TPA: phosphatase PAP2 family protein [Bryobacteraceae bacterium]|nr:phosphatase PAP2 family protein [Bryobacteraceae bacterium]
MKSEYSVFVLAALLVAAGHAQNMPAKTLKVLTPADIDPGRLLPPPPADGSESQRQELKEVERLVDTRSKERFAQAKWDNQHEDPTAFASTLGLAFDLTKLPATAKLLALVMNDQSMAANGAKAYFHRRFPVAAAPDAAAVYRTWSCDEDVKKPADRPLRSYPSGHATMGYSVGIVLAALMPEKSQAILARAADYAYSREVCGDHYHSDVEASHALGNAVGEMLLSSAGLKSQIEAARAELRAAGLTAQ